MKSYMSQTVQRDHQLTLDSGLLCYHQPVCLQNQAGLEAWGGHHLNVPIHYGVSIPYFLNDALHLVVLKIAQDPSLFPAKVCVWKVPEASPWTQSESQARPVEMSSLVILGVEKQVAGKSAPCSTKSSGLLHGVHH